MPNINPGIHTMPMNMNIINQMITAPAAAFAIYKANQK